MRGNARRFNFVLASAAVLQKYDAERDEAQRDRMQAAVWGVEAKDSGPAKPPPTNGRKQTMTQADIMEKYGKQHG